MHLNDRVRFLHHIREQELEASLEMVALPSGATILDFGGGDGFAASLLATKGFKVASVDLAPRSPQWHPVIKIGAPTLPFADASFDFIYSSNVLEHVENLPETLAELRRVLKPGSAAVFAMPTPMWRLSALLELPLKLFFRRILHHDMRFYEQSPPTTGKPAMKRPHLIKRAIRYILRPHGTSPTALHEFYTFSAHYWRNTFTQNNFEIKAVVRLPLFHTPGMFLPWRLMSLRQLVSAKMTASCLAYCVQPKPPNIEKNRSGTERFRWKV